ncbi:amino acid permease, partial [Dyella sp.]|uniref:amino acid permease n=1 Tax=Dyella sp. TaxID=1869338 RepID=UPI003F80D853
AFKSVGLSGLADVIAVGAIIGILTVMFTFMLGVTRVWFSMSRDGLLPKWFAKIHPKYGTPARPTMILGVFTALVAGFLPIGEVAELVNIGTLAAFIIICGSVLILRVRQPHVERRFRTPMLWLVAPAGMLFSLFLIIGWPWFADGRFQLLGGLPMITIWRFIAWMALGLVIYFAYGMRHSELAKS